MESLTPAEVAFRLESPWSEKALARSAIVANGMETGQTVTGEVLEASVRWNDCYLLFVTDGIPFEDCLRIYLFDSDWNLLDSASLGGMYTTGAFSDLELVPPDVVRFRFIGGITWVLELLDHSVASLPFTDPKGVSRPFSLTKRFKLHGRPIPEGRHT